MRARPRRLALLSLAFCFAGAGVARADPEWPVRLNVSMPLGYTTGEERVQGFTWGFRGSVGVYPVGRLAFGGHAEMLLDTETHSLSSFTASISHPVRSFPLSQGWAADWRVGVYGGVRYSGEGTDSDARLATGIYTELAIPAYLYEFRVGLRFDGTFLDGLSATMILVDLDLAVLFALVGRGAGTR